MNSENLEVDIETKQDDKNEGENNTATPFELPTFKGYTIDTRLKQFRKVTLKPERSIEFVDFDSERGEELLCEMEEYFSFLFEPELS